MDRNAKNKMNR